MSCGPFSASGVPSAASNRALAIALGGVLGATLRWSVLEITPVGGGFPWPLFAINVAGSALLGVIVAERWRPDAQARLWLYDGAGIGFCGGLTTFSTFAVEVARFLHDGRLALGLAYSVASVAASIIAGWSAATLAK